MRINFSALKNWLQACVRVHVGAEAASASSRARLTKILHCKRTRPGTIDAD